MNRRSFIQLFLGACAAHAVEPEAIMPAVEPGPLMDDLAAIRGNIIKTLSRRSPWMDLLEPGTFPADTSVVVRERA